MNGSFEDSVYCGAWLPNNAEVTTPYTGISAVAGSVDHWSVNCGTLPTNGHGHCVPQDGNSIVGFFALFLNGPQEEIPQIKLNYPIENDSCYRVSFHLRLSDYAALSINQIRAAFMQDSIYLLDEVNNFSLGINDIDWSSDPSQFIDHHEWKEYTFDYIATGNEKFLAISSLQKPSEIIYKVSYPDSINNLQAYYYLDNVSVVKIQKKKIFPNVFTPNNDGVNDIWEAFLQGYPTFTIKIFNRWGEPVFETDRLTKWWNGGINNDINRECSEGIYYYIFESPVNNKKDIQSGYIYLFR